LSDGDKTLPLADAIIDTSLSLIALMLSLLTSAAAAAAAAAADNVQPLGAPARLSH